MVKLHRVTMWVVDTGDDVSEDAVEQVRYAMEDRDFPIASITEVRTVEFDREWDDDDPLNNTENLANHAMLEGMMEL